MANSKKGTKQVNPPTPKAKVAKQFGGKGQLVDAILAAIPGAPEGSRSKLMQTANSKLISHHRNTQRLVHEFGSVDGAVTAVLALRFPKGASDVERAKVEGQSPWRLMDMHRQAVSAVADAAAKKEAAAKARATRTKAHSKTRAATRAAAAKTAKPAAKPAAKATGKK